MTLSIAAACAYGSYYVYFNNLSVRDVWLVFPFAGSFLLWTAVSVLTKATRRRRFFAMMKSHPPRLEYDAKSNRLIACLPIIEDGSFDCIPLELPDVVAVLKALEPARKAWYERDYGGHAAEQLDEWIFYVRGKALASLPARSGQRGAVQAFLSDVGVGIGLSRWPKCEYPIGGVATQQCPECGTETPIDRAR